MGRRMSPKIDLTGMRFGVLVVVRQSEEKASDGHIKWVCRCDCGNIKTVTRPGLRRRIKSCQCHRYHGLSNHPLYYTWSNMNLRCYKSTYPKYKDYGGRGIAVCGRWRDSVINFYEDCIGMWRPGLTIDRIDNNGNYEPGNVRFADPKTQTRNRRNILAINGVPLFEIWESHRPELSYRAFVGRIKGGWSVERAINTPADYLRHPWFRENHD